MVPERSDRIFVKGHHQVVKGTRLGGSWRDEHVHPEGFLAPVRSILCTGSDRAPIYKSIYHKLSYTKVAEKATKTKHENLKVNTQFYGSFICLLSVFALNVTFFK